MAAAAPIPKAETPTAEAPRANWQDAAWLPCTLTAEIPVRGFTIGHLLCLEVNAVIDAQRLSTEDVPVHVNGKLVGWSEFETDGQRLSVRLTQLA